MRKLLLTLLILTSCTSKSPYSQGDLEGAISEDLIAVDASVYKGLMNMLNIGERCVDLSYSMRPNPETVLASGAKILMLSAYDLADTLQYTQ